MKKENKIVLRTKDYLVSGEEFELRFDPNRQLLATHPSPNPEQLPKYYESDSYISHSDSKKGLFNYLYQSVKKYSLRNKVALISKLCPKKGKLLDIGAGTGAFVNSAEKNGWQVSAVEPNEKARALVRNKGISCVGDLDAISEKPYNVVTLWHVLEHMPNLTKATRKISELVSENGYIVLAVPNYRSFDAQFYKKYWAAYDVPRHLWHFSRKSIPGLFPEFRLLATKPMIFDSFYVSLLSEKYRGNRFYPIGAFFIGLWSNVRAWRSGEYSSLIYILQKR